MAIVCIQDLLDRARQFESRLEKYYAAIREESKDNGVRLLTYYLSKHRRHLDQVLENYSPAEIERIFKIQLKYDLEFHPEKDFKLMDKPVQEVKGLDLLQAAVDYDLQLVRFYRNVLFQPLGAEAAVLFQSLVKLEEKDVVMLKKMIAMNYF